MDPRKQKRLGPAPIASFEKSFEDTTSLPSSISQQQVAAASNVTTATATTFAEISSLPLQDKCKEEEVVATHLPKNINQQVDYAQEIAKEFYGNANGDGNAGVIQKLVSTDTLLILLLKEYDKKKLFFLEIEKFRFKHFSLN